MVGLHTAEQTMQSSDMGFIGGRLQWGKGSQMWCVFHSKCTAPTSLQSGTSPMLPGFTAACEEHGKGKGFGWVFFSSEVAVPKLDKAVFQILPLLSLG